MRTRPPVFKPFLQEPIEFRGGPMDGHIGYYSAPLKPHVYWKNRNGTYEIYVLRRNGTGWLYWYDPEAIVGDPPTD